jgi:hypothetical protein
VSFFHLPAHKAYAPPHYHALDAAPDHLVIGHGRIARGQSAHGHAGSGLGLARFGPWTCRQWVGPSQIWPMVHNALCHLVNYLNEIQLF